MFGWGFWLVIIIPRVNSWWIDPFDGYCSGSCYVLFFRFLNFVGSGNRLLWWNIWLKSALDVVIVFWNDGYVPVRLIESVLRSVLVFVIFCPRVDCAGFRVLTPCVGICECDSYLVRFRVLVSMTLSRFRLLGLFGQSFPLCRLRWYPLLSWAPLM